MVIDGPRPISRVAAELGINDSTLRGWVKEHRLAGEDDIEAPGDAKSDRELQLEREVRKLREENAFLKKASAFFAREQG
ncbi:transposase [Streptomyces sp. SID3343]|nr:transposase [Streptomyces sp. SID3343]MYW04148.1 transposase [Streptomyces sp. SID3343]MYW06166.1 transposase [Streptomyces sp. SID3343]